MWSAAAPAPPAVALGEDAAWWRHLDQQSPYDGVGGFRAKRLERDTRRDRLCPIRRNSMSKSRCTPRPRAVFQLLSLLWAKRLTYAAWEKRSIHTPSILLHR